jgi:hypothetical protein
MGAIYWTTGRQATQLNLPEMPIIKAMKELIGDSRDWKLIETWAMEVAEALRQSIKQGTQKGT